MAFETVLKLGDAPVMYWKTCAYTFHRIVGIGFAVNASRMKENKIFEEGKENAKDIVFSVNSDCPDFNKLVQIIAGVIVL